MDGDHLPHPTTEFGELFEEESFETTLSDQMRLENGTGLTPSETIEQKYVPPLKNYVRDEEGTSVEDTKLFQAESKNSKSVVRVNKDAEHFARININKYFRNKGYRENLVPKTVEKDVIADLITPDISRVNSILFGTNYKIDEIHEEFEKFLKFYQHIKLRNLLMSKEIKPMLLPALVFFFKESYSSGFVPVSSKLIGDFSRKILQEDKSVDNYLIIMAMNMVKTKKAFEGGCLSKVCNQVHKFVVSEWTFGQLRKFLRKLKKNVLLNILTKKFVIELRSCQQVAEAFSMNANDVVDMDGDASSEIETPDENISESSKRITNAERIIHRLRGTTKANMPSLLAFTTNGQPTCATVSSEGSTFAFGMATTGIRVFPASSAKDLRVCEANKSSCQLSDVKTLSGHIGAVYSVKFHPKTKILYSVGQDKEMRSWDLTHEKSIGCKAVYGGHLGPIWNMDISHSGQLIATGSSDTTARIWLPERTECVRILVGHYFDVDCVRFHPNESYVATGSPDKSVRLWSVSDGNLVRIFTGIDGKVSTLAFHKSGKYIVSGGNGILTCGKTFCDEGLLRVWDIGEGELLAELPCLNYCKDISFHGNMLAACFKNGSVQVWNLRSIVGGDGDCTDFHIDTAALDNSTFLIPEPYTVQCCSSGLTNLWYKDSGSLYCMGSDPYPHNPFNEDNNTQDLPDDLNDTDPVISSPKGASTIPAALVNKFNSGEISLDPNKRTILTSMEINQSIIACDSLDDDTGLEDGDAENTNNTITSSDMEFEVDDQMLESFVDDSNSLLQT